MRQNSWKLRQIWMKIELRSNWGQFDLHSHQRKLDKLPLFLKTYIVRKWEMKSVWAKDAKRRNHTTSIHKHTRKFKLINYVKLEILRFDIWRTIIFVNLNENLDDWFRNSAQKKKKKIRKLKISRFSYVDVGDIII